MRQLRMATLFLPLVGLLVGCPGAAPTGDVSGTVTYDSQPIEQGSITFTPADGKGPTAGGSIVGGKYTAPKVPAGAAKVSISGAKATGKKKMYDDPNAPLVQTSSEMLPDKYNKSTVLQYDVAPGIQTKDFDLAK